MLDDDRDARAAALLGSDTPKGEGGEVTAFFESSVLVAAFYKAHVRHEASLSVIAAVSKKTAFCAAHTLAGVYSVMTRLSVRPRISPDQGLLFDDPGEPAKFCDAESGRFSGMDLRLQMRSRPIDVDRRRTSSNGR